MEAVVLDNKAVALQPITNLDVAQLHLAIVVKVD